MICVCIHFIHVLVICNSNLFLDLFIEEINFVAKMFKVNPVFFFSIQWLKQ